MLKILIVEDDDSFSALMERFVRPLRAAFPTSELMVKRSLSDALEEIGRINPPDITLLDLSLPPHTVEQTLTHLDSMEARTAVVIITGQDRERVQRLLNGRHTPVISKDEVVRDGGLLIGMIVTAVKIFNRRKWAAMEADLEIIRGVTRGQL